MASRHKKPSNFTSTLFLKKFRRNFLNYDYYKSLLLNPAELLPLACLLVVLEVIINVIVIRHIKYTEIDWRAYMQEVEGVLNGTYDYSLLKGDTGPLVYPAGFVWIFSGLYLITNKGENIYVSQYIFAGLYILNLILVLRIYIKAKKIPPYVFILSCLTSYRVHSIFVLRLFNDPVAVILLYLAINAFMDSKWTVGSIFFSLAVSVKMNILLYAPALLMAYLQCLGFAKTILQLAICAGIQIFLALPFLLTHPINYILGAFNLGRVFLYEWTVNWRFLPEEIFVDRKFHIGLLILHFVLLLVFYKFCALQLKSFAKLKAIEKDIKPQLKKNTSFNMNTSSQLFLLPMFLCNFIGVACSRSLHYQFYIWYFHSLPFLIWSTSYSVPVRLSILGIIEMCWNTFPSTSLSSAALHCCHAMVLFGIYKKQTMVQKVFTSEMAKKH